MTIGILGAMRDEVEPYRAALVGQRALRLAGLDVHGGHLDGCAVALVAGGIGKVNAALAATLLCAHFGCRALILSGVAGGISARLELGDLVVATSIVDLDYGRATDGGRVRYRPGDMPLPQVSPGDVTYRIDANLEGTLRRRVGGLVLPPVVLRPGSSPRAPVVHHGPLATTDAFVASEEVRDAIGRDTGALAVEMEGAAVAAVAERFGVPWLVVRAVSDRAGTDSGLDFTTFLAGAAASAATLVRTLLPAIAELAPLPPRPLA